MSSINLHDLPYFVVAMPYTDQGLGPAAEGDVYGGTSYEVWGRDYTTVARYEFLEEAMEDVFTRSGVTLTEKVIHEVTYE